MKNPSINYSYYIPVWICTNDIQLRDYIKGVHMITILRPLKKFISLRTYMILFFLNKRNIDFMIKQN